jgi:hypothetical protein
MLKIKCDGAGGEKVTLLLRPQAEIVEKDETLSGKVTDVVFRGQTFRIELGNGLYFFVTKDIKPGETVKLKVQQVECL